MDLEKFMDRAKDFFYQQLVEKGVKDASIVYSDKSFYVVYKNEKGDEQKFFVDVTNIYGVYQELKIKGCSDDEAFNNMKHMFDVAYNNVNVSNYDFEVLKNRIYPKVYVKVNNETMNIVVNRQFVDDYLFLYYVIDYEDRMMYVTKEFLKDWGIGVDELEDIAIKNFARDTNKKIKGIDVAGLNEKVYVIGKGSDYEPSKMLFRDVFTILNSKLNGNLLVVVPNRDTLFVFSDSNVLLVNSMRALAFHHYSTRPYPVSSKIFRYDRGLFSVYS